MKKILILILILSFLSCKNSNNLIDTIEGKRIAIDTSLKGDASIENFIAPYKEYLNKTLDSTLAYNPISINKSQGELNTAIGNLMADIIMEQVNPVFRSRTGKEIDMVLLNYGGIRSDLPKGAISARSAYRLMPFENEVVIVELSGKKIMEMLQYLERARTAHPVSGIKIETDKNFKITSATINGEEIKENRTYLIATSDYLQQGGDNMNFLMDPVNLFGADYKIRNAIIDYFMKIDTVKAGRDDRYLRIE